MVTTITQYFIGRDAIAESDYQSHDKVSYVDYSDNPEAVPDKFIAAILAEVIDKKEAENHDN